MIFAVFEEYERFERPEVRFRPQGASRTQSDVTIWTVYRGFILVFYTSLICNCSRFRAIGNFSDVQNANDDFGR